MTAFDASSDSHVGTGFSASEPDFAWTHTPVGTPRGVVVFVLSSGNTSDLVTGVTYGGVAMSAVSGGRAVDTAGETGDCKAYELGSGVPPGPQTIEVTRTNNSTGMRAFAFSVTAAGDTEVHAAGIVLDQNDGTLAERSVDDGSPGTNSVRFAALNSGLSAVPSAGANSTAGPGVSFGSRCMASVRETTPGQGSRPIGWSSGSSDDRAGVYLAVRETGGGAPSEGSGTASGVGSAVGQGFASHYGDGTSSAVATAAGQGYVLHYGAGSASATGSAVGEGDAPEADVAEGSGVAGATGSASGEGRATHSGAGTASASASVAGEGYRGAYGAGEALGIGSAIGQGQSQPTDEEEEVHASSSLLVLRDEFEDIAVAGLIVDQLNARRYAIR